jgi:pilus assembly protein Flp/PilA
MLMWGRNGPKELCMITSTIKLLMKLMREEDGQDLIEYAIVAGLIGVGAIVSLSSLDTKIKTAFNSVGNQLTNAT